MSNRSKYSVVWDFFTRLDDDQAKCGICKTILKVNRSSSTNLIRHLRTRHPTTNLAPHPRAVYVPNPLIDNPDDPVPDPLPSTLNQASTSTLPVSLEVVRPQQLAISNYFQRPISATKRQSLDQQLLKDIVMEYQPFTIVEDPEFRKFVHMLNPGYDLPSRKTVSLLLSNMYNQVHDEIKASSNSNVEFVSLTTDTWTSLKHESYTAITVHFIDENCKLNSHLLSCFKFSEKHTSENLKTSLLEITENWGIHNKIVACTSDNSANISLAVRLCQWEQRFCFAHSLNLIVQSSLNEINETREKVKSIVEFFKRSTNASENFNKMQEQLHFTPTLTLLQDVVTRWNFTFDMFQRFLNLKTPIISTLSNLNRDVQFSLNDWNTLTQSCSILERFKEITIDLSSEKSVSISKVILYSQALKKYITNLPTKDLTPQVNNMLNKLKGELNKRFGANYESNTLLSEATFLDPWFKKYGFQNEKLFQKVKETIISKCKRIVSQIRTTIDQNVNIPAVVKNIRKENSIWQEFDTGVENVIQSLNPTATIIVEVDKYLQEPPISRTQDPLEWWNINKQIYPTVYIMMKKRLCIQATSVPQIQVIIQTKMCDKYHRNAE